LKYNMKQKMMKAAIGPSSLCSVAMMVLCFCPGATAAPTCDPNAAGCMQLTSAGNGDVLGPAYIGPYVATIAGVQNVNVICDDFATDSSLDSPWAFKTSTLADLTNAKFKAQPDDVQKYEEVAWLSEQLLYNPVGTCTSLGLVTTNCQGDLQYAIWSIFDPLALNSIGGSDLSTADALVTTAGLSKNLNADYSNVTIYTANPQSASQEFIVVHTPEPSALALLGVDLSGVMALVFFFVRRERKRAAK